ncbi:acetyltransferase [Colletotrichum abscissum]|uniref:Acetyltransferase n=1 Tax=Colletotrichum abscissum TaxID=1671311 RepID=A0A9P9XPS9_9PEZI|nr:acetyltransferase [Colletotrichum abscissum]KAI3558266.1 acetyltransferase [Colletotrichum abscissum]KAK1501756.1 acetyltransferase [Colletotrichum abscissum]
MTTKKENTLKLEEATLDDVPALTETWFAAFAGDEVISRLWPDTPGVRAWWDEANGGDMAAKTFQRFVKVVDVSSVATVTGTAKAEGGDRGGGKGEEGGGGGPRIAAWAKWDTSMPAERGRRYPPWAGDMPSEVCDLFFAREEAERERVMGDERHYYLDTLVTHPEYQRRGAASMLLAWGCALADEDGVAAYVDASKAGKGLYERFGFVDESLDGDGDVASMVRRRR